MEQFNDEIRKLIGNHIAVSGSCRVVVGQLSGSFWVVSSTVGERRAASGSVGQCRTFSSRLFLKTPFFNDKVRSYEKKVKNLTRNYEK